MFMQNYTKTNVLEAAKNRMQFIFDNFENVICSISGGKDSTVMCHIALLEAIKRDRKLGIFFFDEEVVYDSTIEQIEYLMNLYPENTNRLWLQIEFNLTNAVSYTDPFLKAWAAGEHDIWMRKKKSYAIKFAPWDRSKEKIKNKHIGLDFYDVIYNFETIYKNTAFLVGLRADESLNRWRTMVKNPVIINDSKFFWATSKGKKNNISAYPIFDWKFSDIWKYIYDNNLKYSKIYDYMYKKGFNIPDIRISSLIHERSFKSLCDLPEFEPKTYAKLCNRIKGIQFAQETGRNKKMFRIQKLPKNYKTWKQYRDFLLLTFQDQSKKQIFITRFKKHLENEFVARQQCRQLILNDYENNIPVINTEDPNELKRQEIIKYYMEVL
jgi:predicted phosphoadenosine phosphosulfate sulfurtransferase